MDNLRNQFPPDVHNVNSIFYHDEGRLTPRFAGFSYFQGGNVHYLEFDSHGVSPRDADSNHDSNNSFIFTYNFGSIPGDSAAQVRPEDFARFGGRRTLRLGPIQVSAARPTANSFDLQTILDFINPQQPAASSDGNQALTLYDQNASSLIERVEEDEELVELRYSDDDAWEDWDDWEDLQFSSTNRDGLSEETITKNLKTRSSAAAVPGGDPEVVMHARDDGDEIICIICQGSLFKQEEDNNDNHIIATVDCGHEYHEGCIKTWLRRKNSCPLCRATALREPL